MERELLEPSLIDVQYPSLGGFDDFDGVDAFSASELGMEFERLTEIATQQPDDELARQQLISLVVRARESGRIDHAMRMAMTLGAMACIDNHLAATANEAGIEAFGAKKHDHDESEQRNKESHEKEIDPSCRDCSPTRPCSRHERHR